MTSGVVFDIVEFAMHDGPGIRTTVFLKGCPLACSWCHNPEALSSEPQTATAPTGTRTIGQIFTAQQLAERLNSQADILRANEGGVTFSGGEPLAQAAFVAEVIPLLQNLHVVLDTSGYGSEDDFRLLASLSSLVYFDLKIMDPELHETYTGRDNAPILRNLRILGSMAVPFVARIPLVPGVTDTDANIRSIAAMLRDMPGLVHVDLLSYNRAAGGKYQALGMSFNPRFDESHPVNANTRPFEEAGLKVRIA
jgi:pyruvate formate lyase activating enzyme